jgi:plasmid stabilization system protein ParE
VKIEWSVDALADLDRFAEFLQEHHPDLSGIVAGEIVARTRILASFPELGRPMAGRKEYRELFLRVLNAVYVFQYRLDGERITMLRVFHGREKRD